MPASGNGAALARNRRTRRSGRRRAGNGHGSQAIPGWLKAVIALGAVGFMALFAAAIIGVVVYRSYADDLLAPDELAINQPSYGAKIYDRKGNLLYEYVDDRSGLRRPVKLANISPAFLAATIATEDDSFFTNPGVNIRGLVRAAWENSPFSGTGNVFEGSGGSSITQQLVKNVYIPQSERIARSVSRKLKETVFAVELTQNYSKERILEWYVNQISYGGVYNGVEAASQGYFGKPASELTLAESALLAGIPQSPAEYDPVNNPEASTFRRNQILDIIERHSRVQVGEDVFYEVPKEELAAAREAPVEIAVKRFPIEAPHFVLQYVEPQLEQMFGREGIYREGLVVTTTLDLEMYHKANEILERWIREFENVSNSRNGAVMVMDPKTGEIIVMVGSRDYFREDIQGKNNNATAVNSPGSAFKPFVYLTSFLKLGWGPGTLVLDTPISIPQADGSSFTPTNPGRNFQGPITIRNALGNSLNIPPIKTAMQVGVDNVVAQAKKMGFTTLTGTYGPSIATGGVDLTPLEMAYGYSVFAADGVMNGQEPLVRHRTGERTVDPISILKVTDAHGDLRFDIEQRRKSERIVEAEYTFLVSSILSDSQAQCITFGCGGISIPGRQAAVKTGTSEPFDPKGPNAGKIGDTWAFGYTPEVVVGIWAGNSDNSPIVNIFSTSISFRAMRDVLQATYDGRPSTQFTRPPNVVEETVCVPSGMKPSPLCGRTTRDLILKDKLPEAEDNWWQRVRIDVRNDLLAGPQTPAQFTEERAMIVPPRDGLSDVERKRILDWAIALSLPIAPTEVSTAPSTGVDLSAYIVSPAPGTRVSGAVQINGYAASAGFTSYRLEVASAPAFNSWRQITASNQRVENGLLGQWDTHAFPPGAYMIRLVVQDRQRGEITASVLVSVGGSPTPGPGAPPLRP